MELGGLQGEKMWYHRQGLEVLKCPGGNKEGSLCTALLALCLSPLG